MINENKIKNDAFNMRKNILDMCYKLKENAGHLGGCMSLVEIMAVIYDSFVNKECDVYIGEERTRIIMSKGHGSITYYAAMHQAGFIKDINDVKNLIGEGNIYYKQVVRNKKNGFEFSSGSLGQGLGYAIGIAWALKQKNISSTIYVFMGDGECAEGSVWEAASIAGHLKLDNIVAIIDRNNLQIDGFTKDINNMDLMVDRWKSFGFETVNIDGHDINKIYSALKTKHCGKPLAIVADTIKGKTVSFAENKAEWHQKELTKELYEQAIKELEMSQNDKL